MAALDGPIRAIAGNGGVDGSVVVDEVSEKGGDIGYNANTGEYVDMYEVGIIDPAKVTRSALQNAGSIAGLMLTTEVLVARMPEDEEEGAKVEGSIR